MILDGHEKIALQFSGGKDSLACLMLLREHWDRITVCWMNTGAAYPEVIAQMDAIKRRVPKFLEVQSDQPGFIRRNGFPSDVGMEHFPHWSLCCTTNMWAPMNRAMKDGGYTLIIRGQKNSDVRKAPVRSGETHDGIKYYFPLEDWSTDEVERYLKYIGEPIPKSYQWANTSLDCWSCTAFLDEREKELSNLPTRYPIFWVEVSRRLAVMKQTIDEHADRIHQLIRGIPNVEKN